MPSKLPRRRDAGDIVPLDPKSAVIFGAAHVVHGMNQAGAQVTSAAITTAGHVLKTTIQQFGECFCAAMDYMREREITARVVAQEREATARVEAWSAAVIAEAEERTEQVRIQASLVLAAIEDRRAQRSAKLDTISGFMVVYQLWNEMLTKALAERANRMPLDERELLNRHIDRLFQRAREMEQSITTIAVSL